MESSKENKKRFFRKNGQSQSLNYAQLPSFSQAPCHPSNPSGLGLGLSFDSHLLSSSPSTSSSCSSSSCCPAGGMRQTKQTTVVFPPPAGHSYSHGHLYNLQDIHALQSLQNLHNLQISKQKQKHQQSQAPSQGHQGHHRTMGPTGSGNPNSISLDEGEIHMNSNRRSFAAAPRRARSAERFDGMRVQQMQPLQQLAGLPQHLTFHQQQQLLLQQQQQQQQQQIKNGSGSGESYPPQNRARSEVADIMMTNKYQHHRSINPTGGLVSTPTNVTGPVNVTQAPNTNPGLRRPVPVVGVPAGKSLDSGYPVPSPPPSYTTAINESRDPPPYHQAVGGKQQKAKGIANNSSRGLSATHQQLLNQANNYHPQSQVSQNNGLRTVASTPIFPSIDTTCNCHKCSVQSHEGGDVYNDAVYMESQAFLMHEIMTDGMAFCSIV